MAIIDLAIIIALLLFVAWGFAKGFISALGILLGLVFGTWAAGRFYEPASLIWSEYVSDMFSKLAAFLLIFILVNCAVAVLFYLIKKIFKVVSVVPFVKSINRLVGGILGLVEGVLFVGLIVYVIGKFSFSPSIDQMLIESRLAPTLVNMSDFIITKLLPEALNRLQSVI